MIMLRVQQSFTLFGRKNYNRVIFVRRSCSLLRKFKSWRVKSCLKFRIVYWLWICLKLKSCLKYRVLTVKISGQIDLSHTGLSHTGLSHTDLSHTGLSHTGVSHTGLSHTGFSHTKFQRYFLFLLFKSWIEFNNYFNLMCVTNRAASQYYVNCAKQTDIPTIQKKDYSGASPMQKGKTSIVPWRIWHFDGKTVLSALLCKTNAALEAKAGLSSSIHVSSFRLCV